MPLSAYKALSQVLLQPDAKVFHSRNHIRGRIDQVQSPYIRFAPGLSLKATADLPVQSAVFKDGDGQIALYHLSDPNQASFVQSSLSYAGYLLAGKDGRVLIIEQEGGIAIPCALASMPGELTVLAQHPEIAKILRQHYRLRVVSRNPRSFLSADPGKFDVIHLENWGSSLPGVDALALMHLLTREAFGAYLDHLDDGGVLILSRRLLLPPTDAIRLWGTAYESWKTRGVRAPERHLALLRSWDTFTLVVSRQPLAAAHRLEAFAARLNFDVVYLPDMRLETANRFNQFEQPYHALAINRLLAAYRAGAATQFYAAYVCDVEPQSDWRPFPARFLKWTRFEALYTTLGSRLYSLLLSGETVLLVLLAEALVVAAGLLVLPLLAGTGRTQTRSRGNHLFFLAIGCGYMFVELYFIHAFTLLFGDPVVSLMVVLPAVLAFFGAGGLWSQRLTLGDLKKALGLLVA
ncbi:MAG: hypothetical protein MUP74_05600, partial [Desulfobacterales bacterium]|nr:hypothetical protein [Desulfobacterales bacterium]